MDAIVSASRFCSVGNHRPRFSTFFSKTRPPLSNRSTLTNSEELLCAIPGLWETQCRQNISEMDSCCTTEIMNTVFKVLQKESSLEINFRWDSGVRGHDMSLVISLVMYNINYIKFKIVCCFSLFVLILNLI